ncbi:MAG: zf-HC2 domain-containing protein [Candidatus Eremiobacteraeota bacterium]|nr:zf-HC2 domain-containing protein [Candidatus Eremiobacteraeota bacterium]
MSAHIDDDAELYALGALETSERDAVDAHLATCDACTRRVADAERTVGALGSLAWGGTVAPSPRSDARTSVRWSVVAAVLAACFALALGFGLRERSSLATIETAMRRSSRRSPRPTSRTRRSSRTSQARRLRRCCTRATGRGCTSSSTQAARGVSRAPPTANRSTSAGSHRVAARLSST